MSTAAAEPGYDAIIIGAGHNGLVCAWRLASAGRRVLVLEAADHVGGACDTREFAPGFHVSGCAHLLYGLSPALRRLLLANGLSFADTDLRTVALEPGASSSGEAPLTFGPADAVAGVDPDEQQRYRDLMARMREHAEVLAGQFAELPPRLDGNNWRDRLPLVKLGWTLRRMGRRRLRDLLRIGAMCVYDLLQDELEDPRLQAAVAFDALMGCNGGPRSPGTVLTWLHRLAAAGGQPLVQPAGGMGAVTAALCRAAVGAGVEIRTGAEVSAIDTADDRACGVRLTNGERIAARAVISNAGPKQTLLTLLGHGQIDTGLVRALRSLRGAGLCAKLHLALRELPRFTGLDDAQLRARLLLGAPLDDLERAFNASKYGEHSRLPMLEVTLPTLADPSLAPAGKHVLSALVQYVPAAADRAASLAAALGRLETAAPGIGALIEHAEFLTPRDLEQRYRLPGGHWHHAELGFDQFHLLRPVPELARYATPLPGLYLCGAAQHPGGGVLGHAGENAARALLAAGI